MMSFDYSIVIRTLGNTGAKYRCMLDAIERQTVKPAEIIVVIPEGYFLDHRIGSERIVYSGKGMVTQRAVGIQHAKSDYLLVLDDDLDFPDDFVEKLYRSMQEKELDCVLVSGNWSRIGTFTNVNQRKTPFKSKIAQVLRQWRLAFTGQAFYSHRKSKYYDVIASTGGHRTFVNCEDGLCQTGPFACFFIKAGVARAIGFDEDLWLEQGSVSSYAAFDDAVFFYKCFLKGGRIAYTGITGFEHLDAAIGRKTNDRLTAKRFRLYTIARNRTVFWHRYIWKNRRTLGALMGGVYGMVNYAIYNVVINFAPKNWPAIGALIQGYRDAFRLIRKPS